ncbi:hypothetical protein [Laspinema olomoucense]|uniref:Uncharacterized protein n=1 Tax=Laspinema olomoucense D3b TaxID=2953688 RepID=A0ABT2N351_9CYAN|nr:MULTISPECIES: hypothetical protein [unclassified Laspinema]MCT7970891.1 hypothetical protein [Laspinema sp. D3d]MCT7976289.1 hypothetical protein [Laspinema sp. D3b]MCT7993837.1 hypothetical protein [Laspinema sp. D3c]
MLNFPSTPDLYLWSSPQTREIAGLNHSDPKINPVEHFTPYYSKMLPHRSGIGEFLQDWR